MRRCDVMLAVLPFAAIDEPTISVSILKAVTVQAGFSCQVRYFSLDFADSISVPLYHKISNALAARSLLGDWVFSKAAFGDEAPRGKDYVEHLLADYSRWEDGIYYGVKFEKSKNFTAYVANELLPKVKAARELAAEFADQCARSILDQRPRVVGFTSSCQQACSCLAVARRLKQDSKAPLTVFGGANCHGEMGAQWLQSFPWIDYVCIAEGEEAFPALLFQLLRKRSSQPIPGILGRRATVSGAVPKLVKDLDKIPIPDHSDYFTQLRKASICAEIEPPILPIETSRGCWWGQKRQCVFCGNYPLTIPYRTKSPDRVIREIRHLGKGHRFRYAYAVDDALDKKFIKTVFPRLKRDSTDFPIFYQTRPNLKRSEIHGLMDGGVTSIQPGIESLSDEILRLMHKGCSGLQNIRLLRLCEEVGMGVSWRILFGIAGERISEYTRMARLVPLLTHLRPPVACVPIALKRFSPYWISPEPFGLTHIRSWPSYAFIYALDSKEIEGLAYFFDFDYADGADPFHYSRGLRRRVGRWIALWQVPPAQRPRLDWACNGEETVVTDTRPCAIRRYHRLRGLKAKVCRFCDEVRSLNGIVENFSDDADPAKIRKILASLVQNKLLVEDKGRYLNLIVKKTKRSRARKTYS